MIEDFDTEHFVEDDSAAINGASLDWMLSILLEPKALNRCAAKVQTKLTCGLRHYSANRNAVDLGQTKVMEEFIAMRDRQIDLSLGIDPLGRRAGMKAERDVARTIAALDSLKTMAKEFVPA